MRICGVVSEYNPFHKGHAYQIEQAKAKIGEDCAALKQLFGLKEIGFGVPFTACGQREIRIIRKFVFVLRNL